MKAEYKEFLEAKIVIAEQYGTDDLKSEIDPKLLPHQRDIVQWLSLEVGGQSLHLSDWAKQSCS